MFENGKRVELEVKEGDQIIFSKYAGTEVKYEGNEFLILRESDILAVLLNLALNIAYLIAS